MKDSLIGSNLQVAATRQDQENLRVVDWQQYTARREEDHDDIEQNGHARFEWDETDYDERRRDKKKTFFNPRL